MVLGGEAFHGDEILELWEIIVAERWRSGAGRETSDGSVLGRYREGIVSRHRLARPVRVVVDCGNGAGSLVAVSHPRGARRRGDAARSASPTAPFPIIIPIPPSPRTCAISRPRCGAPAPSSGIAFDGDADRIGAVDETGEIIYGDQLLVILGRDAVRRFGPGTPVIFDVKCSEVLPAGARARRAPGRSCGRPGTR